MSWFAIFFFLSGLCSIVYELVWLRLAMAKFGVTTALVSIVLSVFMAGLGAGSWIAGRATRRYGDRIKFPVLRLYGVIELLVGMSALTVPLEFAWGSRWLERIAGAVSISSGSYYLMSGAWLALTLIPWCACMGATIPVAMFAIRRDARHESHRSFSFLYLANVIGAVAGASIAPALVEIYGFHGTLRTVAILNGLICVSALVLSLERTARTASTATASPAAANPAIVSTGGNAALFLLFTTGLTTMGMEVIWIRLYTFFIGPLVYSLAKILATYLAATFVGSKVYRIWSRHSQGSESRLVWVSLAFLGLLPLLTADVRLHLTSTARVILGVAPLAAVVGFLTPMLVDRWSGGDPDRAGRAYAVNVVGCIAGPLLAGFVLLPWFGESASMLLLVLPWFGMAMFGGRQREVGGLQTAATAGLLIASLTLFFFTRDYEARYPGAIILRDSTATVIAASSQDGNKQLFVNGVGMTALSPLTKMMAHFTLAHLARPPRNALIICFGMGTTFRSAMSWGIPVTAVELVPSVPKLFTYYHPDGGTLLASPQAHVVIDDGRRFLDRSAEKFDAIIIDPPPPTDAAGSSLLYSREFYMQVREHLTPGGILQQWLFRGDNEDKAAVTRALMDVFPYVTVYESMVAYNGLHYFASMSPIPQRNASELVARMPAGAIVDMMEWGPGANPLEQFNLMLDKKRSTAQLLALAPGTPALQDDRPINEYNRLRQMFPRLMSVNAPGH
jgi:spermidine synthase/MFS family permease